MSVNDEEERAKTSGPAETTELMLQLVAAKRGISVVPDWLLHEDGAALPLKAVKLGENGIMKCIHLGVRKDEEAIDYIAGFLAVASTGRIVEEKTEAQDRPAV